MNTEGVVRVLVVERDRGVRELLVTILKRVGMEVGTASDGAQALAVLYSSGPVDLVVADLLTPGSSGRPFAHWVRQIDGLHNTPMLAISGLSDSSGRAKALVSGFDAYLAKPFALRTFVETVRSLIDERPQALTYIPSASSSAVSPEFAQRARSG